MEAALAEPQGLERARDAALRVIANVRRAVSGERAGVERAVVALLAEGHVLVEDVPGVGKTMLAQRARRAARLLRSRASSSRPTCCRATSPA